MANTISKRPLTSLQPREPSVAQPVLPTSRIQLSDATPRRTDTRQQLCTEAQVGDRRLEQNDQVEQGNLSEFLDQEELRTGEINHTGRNCYVGTEVSNCNYLVRQDTSKTNSDDCFHFANRQYHPKHTSFDSHLIPAEALKRPERALADKLLNAYFVHINRGWPIVDEELFMIKYNNQIPQNPLPLSLFNAIMLVGAHVLGSHDEEMKALKTVFHRRAKLLIDYRIDQDRIAYIQTAFLLTWYTDGLEEIVANTWHWIGMACRTAHGIGLHRDTSPSKLYDVYKRSWTRLFWVLFQFDTVLSTAYGRPQALNLDESDVPELQKAHFEGVPDAEIDFVIHHNRLCKIISKATKQRWALRSSVESQIEASRQADVALAQFLTQLPPKLRQTSNQNVWQVTLHLTYNNFLLQLHRPPPKQSGQGPLMDALSSGSICSDAALSIASGLEDLRTSDSMSYLWGCGVQSLFTAIVYASNSLSSNNPIIAAKSLSTFESLLTSLRELSHQWQFALSLLSLFERRLRKIRQQRQQSGAHLEYPQDGGNNNFALRPVVQVPGNVGFEAPGPPNMTSTEQPHQEHPFDVSYTPSSIECYLDDFCDFNNFPPLDDFLSGNLLFLEDSSIDNLLVG